MTATTVLIVLDAFRWDYISPVDTPLLFRMAAEGIYARKLRTATGFTQRTALFTGAHGASTGNFTMFTFDLQSSPFRFLLQHYGWQRATRRAWWEGLPDIKGIRRIKRKCSERRRLLAKEVRSYAAIKAKEFADHADPAHIPLEMLPYIGVSEDNRPIHHSGALPVESIFDVCAQGSRKVSFLMFPVTGPNDDEVLQAALDNIKCHDDLYVLQFSESDWQMHTHGTKGIYRSKVTGELDRKLRVLHDAFSRNFDSVNWIILGDHGMTNVTAEVDAGALIHVALQEAGLVHAKDYLLFLDSTMARLYFFEQNNISRCRQLLSEHPGLSQCGRIITGSAARTYHIPWQSRTYGDIIWWAAPGILIFPDYFHTRDNRNRAMHGYDSCADDMKGFAIVHGNGLRPAVLEEVTLVDICPTICDLLQINRPSACEGRSLMEQA